MTFANSERTTSECQVVLAIHMITQCLPSNNYLRRRTNDAKIEINLNNNNNLKVL